MKSGPPRTPSSTLAARGSWRAKGRAAPPRISNAGRPEPLDAFAADELAIWQSLVGTLESLAALHEADGELLIQLAQAIYRHRLAMASIRDEGVVYRAGDFLKRNPACSVAAVEASLIARLLGEAGLTPSAREKLNIADPEPHRDDLARFFPEAEAA